MPAKVPTYKDFEQMSENLKWLWAGWLPLGHVAMLAAVKGAGKTHVALDLAGRVMRGAAWPDGEEAEAPGRVAYLDTEGRKTMIVDRAVAMGLDTEALVYPFPDIKQSPRLDRRDDWNKFAEVVAQVKPMLLVVDSLLRAFLGDENSSRDTGELLGSLQGLAEATGTCVLVVHHLRKQPDLFASSGVTLDRVRGSGAVTQYAASVLVIEPTTTDSVSRLRVEAANLCKEPDPIGFRIDEEGVKWCDVPGDEKRRKALDDAKEFLRRLLEPGHPVPSTQVYAAAREAGISERTLRRASTKLAVQVGRGRGEPHAAWYWVLPKRNNHRPPA